MKKHWLAWSLAIGACALLLAGLAILPRVRHQRLVKALHDENPAIRAAAIRNMSRQGNEELVIEALQDENADVRLLAAQRLGGPGPKGTERGQALVRALNDDHAGVRREAAWAVSLIGSEAWPPLREAFLHERPRVRAGAAIALRDAYRHKEERPWPSRHAEAIVPILDRLLEDPAPEVRHHAKEALQYFTRYQKLDGTDDFRRGVADHEKRGCEAP
jgi:HEAT repeat protein